jgi:uncharacterized protein with ParB-like and HNH nuclease domain
MEANPTLIINYFSGFKQNLVPLFQRPYTWGEKQWRTLWEDILSFYDYPEGESRATHFMGAVVTMPARSVPVGVSKFLVIDGQQRLASVAILLCAVRDALAATDEVRKRKIQNYYLTNDGYDGTDFFKLLPTQGDRVGYTPIIQHPATLLPDSQFKRAYEFFRRRLRDQIEEGKSIDAGKILQLVETRLMVVMINLSDNDDPYLIFESLNFKGSPLEQADLVRNYFLMRFAVNEQQVVYENVWLPMQDRLGKDLTEFMRHFLGAEGEDVRKGDVYASIKRLVADAETASVRLLMTRMEQLSVLYSRIATPSLEPNVRFKNYFECFQRLDFGTVYPLLLALYEDYEDGQFAEEEFLGVLEILFSFIIRRMVVGVPSNSLAGLFVGLCKMKPVIETPSAWLSAALCSEEKNRRWPNDVEFSNAWIHTELYGSRACPVILETIEANFEHHEAVQLDQITVEHVIPQTLSAEWEVMLGTDALAIHAIWLHTIGNLTLTGYNPELSNKAYSEKRTVYALSHFELNRYFANFDSWGQSMIADRATALLKSALQLWPRPADSVRDSINAARATPAAFHNECARRVQDHLKVQLSKLSQTRYVSGDGHIRLVCAVSVEHSESSGIPYYWFGFHQSQLDFLSASEKAFVCLGCGSASYTLLVPLEVIRVNLGSFSVSARHYWHIVIQKKGDRFALRLIGGVDGQDLTDYNVAGGARGDSPTSIAAPIPPIVNCGPN